MRSFVRSIVIAIPFLLMSCMQPQADVAGLKKTVDEYNSALVVAITESNPDTVMMYYADDAISMPPNEATRKGKEAIKEWMSMDMGMKFTMAKFTSTEVDAAGNIGYEVGDFEMTIETPMGEVNAAGKYISVWKKQADGSWKIHAETWNSNTPPPAMEPSKDKKKK